MKRLLLITLAIGGIALITVKNLEVQVTVLVPRPEVLSFGFRSVSYGSPMYLNYYPSGYYRHPYVHYYPYAGNPYSYYSAPPTYRYRGHRTYPRQHRYRHHHSQ